MGTYYVNKLKHKNSLTSGRFVYLGRERDRMGLETDTLVALNE